MRQVMSVFSKLLSFGKGYCALSVLYLILKNPTLLNFDATASKRVLVRSRVLHIDRNVKDGGSFETESKSTNASVSTVVVFVVEHKLNFWCLVFKEEVLCLKLLVKNGLLHVVSDHIKMTVEYCKLMKSSEGSHPWRYNLICNSVSLALVSIHLSTPVL